MADTKPGSSRSRHGRLATATALAASSVILGLGSGGGWDIREAGAQPQPLCGDVIGGGDGILASDALAVLSKAVKIPGVVLRCASSYPATGQTTSYPADKDGEPAAAVADDGALRAGNALSYTDNGDGTITDNNTGLMWEKKSADGGLHDYTLSFRWSTAAADSIWDWIDDVNAEGGSGFAGYDDWRVPNIKELSSIVDLERTYTSIDPVFDGDCAPGCSVTECSCTVANWTWSSTTVLIDAASAWYLHFGSGAARDGAKTTASRVRAVRTAGTQPGDGQQLCGDFIGGGDGILASDALAALQKAVGTQGVVLTCPVLFPATGQTVSYPADKNGAAGQSVPDDGAVRAGQPLAYVDNGDGTITDLNTGLMWENKSDDGTLHDKDNGFYYSSNSEWSLWNWIDDVNTEDGGGFAGHNDWRIPNYKEALSIVDFGRDGPAMAPVFDTDCTPGCSVAECACSASLSDLSSTTVGTNTDLVWVVGYSSAYLSSVSKTDGRWARAVRDSD